MAIATDKALGKKGVASMKLEDFKDHFEWMLKECPEHKVQTKIAIPVTDYYFLGIYCIENNLSIAGFIKFAYNERLALTEQKLINPDKDNSKEIAYKILNSPISKGTLI